ncbi:hypothetical protein SUGI_1172490 [Cryptomeria japonica]|nr:hypothetical protein SUGI_1172490 [Cryptomeria japonica]
MDFEEVKVNPQQVRFSQDSISCNFRKRYTIDTIFDIIPKPSSVRLVCQQMEKGLIKAFDFPPIEVYKDEDGIIWSNDNRRLWVFRNVGVTSVPTKLSSMPLFRVPPPSEKKRGNVSCKLFSHGSWWVVIPFFTSYLF